MTGLVEPVAWRSIRTDDEADEWLYHDVCPERRAGITVEPLVPLSQLQAAEAERDYALEAEDEAKDCFWAIYPEWVQAKGHGISTEAARTILAERAEAAEAEVSKLKAQVEWQPIETAPKDGTAVIIAVPDRAHTDFIVGEAYFDPEHYGDGDWWWANTDYGDYHGGPVSEVNYNHPTHWRPLPAPPSQARALSDEVNDGQ